MTTAKAIHPAIAGGATWQRAVCQYIERLRQHYGEQLVTVVLYGSRARGDADEESDVDLLIVLRGQFDRRAEEEVVSELGSDIEGGYEEHVMLCPVVAPEHDYRRRMLPLLMNIRREGIELWPLGPKAVRDDREEYAADAQDELGLIRRRMKEALDDAEAGLAQGRYEWTANRAYYAMFHAATALLLSEGRAYSRHSGVISAFERRFVNAGRFPRELGRALRAGFNLRNTADYAYSEHITQEQGSDAVGRATAFVTEAERLLGFAADS